MRNLTEAVLYPGIGMIEGTDISVGRGTDTPFEVVGAPWIDETQFAAYLNARRLPGVRFVPMSFTPDSSRYAHQLCHGVYLIVTNRDRLDSPELGIEVASALQHLYPQHWDSSAMHGLAGNQTVVDQIRSGEDPRRIAQDWRDSLQSFELQRQPALLYH
jgi:uncharacterized protein YbbC (DUF1343 family)